MKFAWVSLPFTVCIAVLSLCSGADTVINVPQIVFDNSRPPKDRAEQLAMGAELLAKTGDHDFSEQVVRYALQLDPTNVRAQVVRNENEMMFMAYEFVRRSQWIGGRLKGKLKFHFDQAMGEIKNCASCWRLYSARVGEPFQTGADIRVFFKKVLRSIDMRIAFVNRHQNVVLDLQDFYSGRQETADRDGSYSCPVRVMSPNVFVINSCPGQTLRTSRVDKFDWQAMKHQLLTLKMATAFTLAYSLRDLPRTLVGISMLPPERLTVKTIVETIRQSPRFGRLIDRRSLDGLRSIGAEGSFLVREMARGFECKDGQAVAKRADHLFPDGICDTMDLPFFSGTFDQKARGRFEYIFKVVTEFALEPRNDVRENFQTEMDLRPVLDGDIRSLQEFIPDKFDGCGKPMSFANPKLSGALPRGDLMTLVSSFGWLRRELGEKLQCQQP